MAEVNLALSEQAQNDIFELGRFIQEVVDRRTAELLDTQIAEFRLLFETVGDMAYGTFNTRLFHPIRRALEGAELKASPRLPGGFQSSREWGNDDETHQQRWMLSKVLRSDGTALGTIAVGIHHDHTAFRLPRTAEIVALDVVRPKDIAIAISKLHPEFAAAEEFRVWYAKYPASQC